MHAVFFKEKYARVHIFFLLYRKVRLKRMSKNKNARPETGMTNRRF